MRKFQPSQFNCAYKHTKLFTAPIFMKLAISRFFFWTFLAKFYPNPNNNVESGANFHLTHMSKECLSLRRVSRTSPLLIVITIFTNSQIVTEISCMSSTHNFTEIYFEKLRHAGQIFIRNSIEFSCFYRVDARSCLHIKRSFGFVKNVYYELIKN